MSLFTRYAAPSSLAEAFGLLREVPEARLLNGGTDLLVALRKGKADAPLLIDIKRMADLPARADVVDGVLRVSGTASLTPLLSLPVVREAFPALVEGGSVVGSIQIRNRATLAGNLCNASPAADTATALLVHGASVALASSNGERRLPLEEFLLGPGRTALQPGELLAAVELPLPRQPLGAAFARMTRRRGVDLATVNLTCLVPADGPVRFAFGAVGPRPFLAVDESGLLADPAADERARDEALRALTDRATPISNVRASAEYRREMLFVLARRALADAHRRREASARAA
jgi:carbon-monoxide dehydrogenase medium subunit